MTFVKEEEDFLYDFALTDGKNLTSMIQSCTDQQVRAIAECIINIPLHSSCKHINKIRTKLLNGVRKSYGDWKGVFLAYPETVRRVVARVVRDIIVCEIVWLLLNHEDNASSGLSAL